MNSKNSSPTEAAIVIRRLHYGKLVDAATGAVPAQAGYGVTRRSQDLDPALDGRLSPARLIGRRRFEPESVEPTARRSGCFVARATADDAMTLLRARFRPEDGEEGGARLHQQASVWIVAYEDWRCVPAACLAIAAGHLRADPDVIGEASDLRLAEAPARWRFRRLEAEQALNVLLRASWGSAMLEFFLMAAESDADVCLNFGAEAFANEKAFLTAVGFALQSLPASYPRWRDISVASGLAHPAPGVCLRYSPDGAAEGVWPVAA